jgi:hypothetical protein
MQMRIGKSLTIVSILALASGIMAQRGSAQEVDASPQQQPATTDSAHIYRLPTSVYNAHRVRKVINDGTHVVLADGTIWEVYLPDRPSVNTWKAGDVLIVRESSVSQGEYDYTLKDGRTRGAVYARLVGETN